MTEVILEGPLGKEFGRKWELAVSSPGEALRLIDANKPGIATWIRGNMREYPAYRIICTYHSGNEEDVTIEDFSLHRKAKRITFVPILEGAGGGAGKYILGAALIVGSFWAPELAAYGGVMSGAGTAAGWTAFGSALGTSMFGLGMTMILSGAANMLTPQQLPSQQSFGFGGPVNTTQQGGPVPLIYGTCLVGSQVISAALSVDQLL